MYVCMHVCLYVCMHIHVHMYVCTCACVCICACYLISRVDAAVSAVEGVCMYIYMYVCMYICYLISRVGATVPAVEGVEVSRPLCGEGRVEDVQLQRGEQTREMGEELACVHVGMMCACARWCSWMHMSDGCI